MKIKRTPQREVDESSSKRVKSINNNDYFETILDESGLQLHSPPEKCMTSHETILITRNLRKSLQKHKDYPRNVSEFFENLKQRCDDQTYLKHYLYPNIVRIAGEGSSESYLNDSLIKILLNIPVLQNKLIDYIFEKAIDLAADSKCGPWIQAILKCFSNLDNVVDSDKIAINLINLLDVTSEKMVRLEIITAIPDIIGDQAHENIATEMSRILSEDHDLVPAILDCLSYLCLSDEQYQQLQKKTLNILMALPKCNHFPNFVKFLLMAGRTVDSAYYEAVLGLRNALGWPTSIAKPQDIASSQILTVSAIRTSVVSSKVIANAWLKVITNCQLSADHKPIDFIIILILYSTTEEKQKQVESVIKKQVKLNILNEELLADAFAMFKPILRDYLKTLISLTNSLLKCRGDVEVQHFASHIYTLMFSKLDDCCQSVVAELLQLGLDSKQCVMNILTILNNVAVKDMSLLKPQSVQMLTLLDRMDDMTLSEIRAVMNLVCGLAYSYENSVIRDDIHMIVRKELGSSNPVVKIQGILAGVHAVKYLMASTDEEVSIESVEDVSYGTINHLPEGDLREAAQIIELISRSTRQFPDMIAFFYDELYKIVQSVDYINSHFLNWITEAVTNDLQQNFIIDSLECDTYEELKLNMQYCLNSDSEMDNVIAINIGGLTLNTRKDISILILSPLFQLVQALHTKKHDGNLSSIDALLGCPVIMPIFDIDLIENMSNTAITHVLDCQVHCVNWFRELLNAFASQNDPALKPKILNRVLNIQKLEKTIDEILLQSNLVYKPPISTFNLNNSKIHAYEKKNMKVQNTKSKIQKKTQDVSVLTETLKSQASVRNNSAVKSKTTKQVQSIPFRSLNLTLLNLLKCELTDDKNAEKKLTIEVFIFLLKYINCHLENILVSKIKRNTFLTKKDDTEAYNHKKAEECAQLVNEMLPKLVDHMKFITTYLDGNYFIDHEQDDNDLLYDSDMLGYLYGLEHILNICTTYFKWIGFKSQHKSLLKTSLRTIAHSLDGESSTYVQDLVLSVAKYLQRHEKYCIQLTTAVSLFEYFKAIQEYSSSPMITQIIKELAKKFLSNQWKTPDGVAEKGLFLNQCVDNFARVYFTNNQILELKNITLLLVNDVQEMTKTRNSTLNSFQSVNKANFPIIYRNLGGALFLATKTQLNKRLTNCEHLDLWKNVGLILKCKLEIAKTLDSRNNLVAFFKKTLPIIKLFISHGIPIMELEFKNKTQEILELLKTLQQITRFLQSLCCHSRLKKDTALINKVPYVRQLLETLLYKVKAMLTANNCSEAFWMGNLKNKNIHGEIISTQDNEENNGSGDDCDEQLPDDDDSDATDDEMLNPDSRSLSDIV
ncbi:Fanconi anemia group D2 protein [Vanessa tameamea]|uniref:Fanconi anemia group D2 protein n=1 Tax=Vanessa tameamea TaxID=334116 RepID=A0A8B8I233_VANTA